MNLDNETVKYIIKTFVLFPLGISTFLYLIYYYNLKLTKKKLPKWMKQLKRDKIPKKIEHRWELETFTDSTALCNHCNLLIVQGLICSICNRTCHVDHVKEADLLDCKCGSFISHKLQEENNNNNNARWYQKGLLKRGSTWMSKSSAGSKKDKKEDNKSIIENGDDNIVLINELHNEPSEIEEENEIGFEASSSNLNGDIPLKPTSTSSKRLSKKDDEIIKPRKEESVAYPNENVKRELSGVDLDKMNKKKNIVMLRGSSYYSLREDNFNSEQYAFQDSYDDPNSAFAGILRDPKTLNYQHQWVKYKTQTPYFCQVCNKRISNGPLDFDYHCVWCQICVHKKCINKYTLPCYLSIIPEIVLPPHYVSVSNRKKRYRDEVLPKYYVTQLEGTDINTRTPLVCVINPKSGEGATHITREMYSLLNPVQICDITYDNPEEIILSYIKCFPNCRIIACGGDGTVSWINSIFDKFLKDNIVTREEIPPIGVIPLGTGNDLSRVLGWGGGYEGESAIELFKELAFNSEVIEMDRWKVVMGPDSSILSKIKKPNVKTTIMNNYFSIGSDANIAYAFDTTRKEHPSMFKSRIVNKIWYFSLGGVEYAKSIYNAIGQRVYNLFHHKRNNDSESKKALNDLNNVNNNVNNEAIFTIGDNSEISSVISEVKDTNNNNNNNNNADNLSINSKTKKSKHGKRSQHNSVSLKNGKKGDEENISIVDSSSIVNNDDKKSIKSIQSTNEFSSFDDVVQLEIDGKNIDVNDLSGIIILNINSYGGGSKFFQKEGDGDNGIMPLIKNMFNNTDYPDYSCHDHQLEVVGVYSALHAGASLAGVITPVVLGVVKEKLRMTIKRKMAVQVDGEPWMQNPSVIEITFNNKAKYLKHNGTNLY